MLLLLLAVVIFGLQMLIVVPRYSRNFVFSSDILFFQLVSSHETFSFEYHSALYLWPFIYQFVCCLLLGGFSIQVIFVTAA